MKKTSFFTNSSRQGKIFFIDPGLYVYHFKKDSIEKIVKSTFVSGAFRAQSFKDDPSSFHPLFCVPSLFICYLLALPFLETPWKFLPLVLYFCLSVMTVFQFFFQKRNVVVANIAGFLIPVIHFSYGLGFLKGLCSQTRR